MTDIGLNTQQRNLPTFLNMPLNVANLVLEKMEPMDLLRASKVCRSLRTAVDEFGFRFGHIRLTLWRNQIEILLSDTEIMYRTTENGSSTVIHKGQKKLIDGETFEERAAKDFKVVSKHARKIAIRNFTENRSAIVTSLIEILKSEKCIHVEQIGLWYFSFDEVLTILPCFGAKELKKIVLTLITSIDRFERITHLEQWKNAEVCTIIGENCEIASAMIAHFFHFKCFYIDQMDEFPAQTAIQIRDDLLKRSSFESCYIILEGPHEDPIEIAKVFKPDYIGNDKFNIEYSNSNNKFSISLDDVSCDFELNVKRL